VVAIFSGNGTGFERGSGSILGASGLLGSATQGRSGDGVFVNAANGNLLLNRQDEFLVGRGPDVAIARTYNSLATLSDDNDDKWRQSTDRRVFGLTGTLNTAGSTVRRVSADGSDITYSWNATKSAYVTTDGAGAYDMIVKAGNEWHWTDGTTQIVEKYNDLNGGRIVWEGDPDGNAISYTYVGDKLDKATTADGSWTQYTWSGNTITKIVTGYTDLVTSTAKTLSRTWYEYTSGRLSKVRTDLTPADNTLPTDAQSYWIAYGYDASGRVNSITQKDGSSMAVAYDGSGRVQTLTQTASSGVTRVTSFAYAINGDGSGYTNITDATGQVTRLDYNAARHLTKITAPPAFSGAAQQIVQFAYDAATGDLLNTTDALGNVSSYTYNNGNMVTATDRLGNVVTRTYGAKNELTSETRTASDAASAAASITTRYVYDGENHLRYAISGEGRVTEFAYTGVGQLLSTVEYPEHIYPIGTAVPTEAAMNSWRDAIADRQSVQVATNTYDTRGNLTAAIRYGYATAAGAGSTAEGYSRTYYTYDQAGKLLARNNESENVETFLYDGMGRMTSSTDVNGGVTTIEFLDTSTITRVTLASGYVTTETYNLAGDLINRTDSGSYVQGGTTANAYDKLGRLRVATDATGFKSYFVYDKAGRRVADVNHYGDMIEYRYDANNRIVATARYATRLSAANLTTLANPDAAFDLSAIRPAGHASDVWTWTVYDKEGRTLSTVGGDGGVTAYSYDAAGRHIATTGYVNKLAAATITGYKTTAPTTVALPATHANDTVARTFYDRDGLLLGVLDGEGYLTRSVYDRAGQKVGEVAYFGITTANLRVSGSFDQLVASVGTSAHDRWTRFVYDGQGLLRYAIDGLNQATVYNYDKAGREIEETRLATAMAATSDYTYDNVKALLAPQAGAAANRSSWSVYDTAGRLAYSIDPEGAVTGFAYDNRSQVTRTVQYTAKNAQTSAPSVTAMNNWSATAIGNSANRVTRHWYTARGEARYTVDAEGYIMRTDYDAEGRRVAQYRWDNRVTVSDSTTIAQAEAASIGAGGYTGSTIVYRADGKVHYETDGTGVWTLYDYYANGLLESRYLAYGTADQSRTYFTYDNAGRLASQADAYGTAEQGTTQFAYDGLGNRTSITNARGKVTSFTYDKAGQLKTTTNAAGSTSNQYNAFGETLSATDARNLSRSFSYDVIGRVKTVTDALSGLTTYEYNRFGEVWKTDDKGSVSYSWYDKMGRVTHRRDAENALTQTSYTTFGEIASVTKRYNLVSGTAVVGTPAAVTTNASEDATTSFVYDKLGRLTTATDALGFYQSYGYDAVGNRVSVTAKSATAAIVAGATTTYTYNRRGNMLTETLPTPTHDSAGNQISTTVVNRFEYDARGNRTKRIEADNLGYRRTSTYIYDKRNRLTETRGDAVSVIADDLVTTSSVTPTELIRYDAAGNIIETVDAGGARTLFYYDDADRKTVEIRQTSATENIYSTSSYDANGNVLTTRVYGGSVAFPATAGGTPPAAPGSGYRETSFTYDNLNRVATSQVSGVVTGSYATGYAAANLVTSYQYDARGNLVKLTDPNGGLTYSWFDKLNRNVARLDAEGYLTTWALDPDGNATTERRHATQFTGTVSLTAPPAPAQTGNDRVTQFTYDKAGNRLSQSRLSVEAYAVNASNGALSAAGTTATVSYLYNGLGQVVRKTEATGDQVNYAYDAAGRLSTETRAAFVDFNGQSVSPTTQYLYDGLGNLSRTVQSGATNTPARTTTYAYAAGGRLASMTDASGFTRNYAYDAMGRVKKESYTRITAAGGSVTDASATRYDLAGRKIFQGAAKASGGGFAMLDYRQTLYNGYGDIWKQGVNGLFQSENIYDNAGRLTATNGGDGAWKLFGYDRNGNQTVAITSAGTSLAGQSFTGALALVSQATVNATYTSYDKRNLAVQVVEDGRQLSASTTDQSVTNRTYTAFGEVATETNALGATLSYTYNTLGKLIKTESPYVYITLENGTPQNMRPTENHYYDLGGRLVGSRDANNNLSTRSLLAGTGYGGGAAMVVASFAADTGKVTNAYDIHGDVRSVTDQLGRVTTQTYDAMGRITQIARFGGLVEGYAYDGLGQRIQAWNNQFQSPIYGPPEQVWVEDPPYWNYYDQAWEYPGTGHYETYTPIIGYAAEKALTEYDSQGRVISTLGFGGDLTTQSYSWNSGISTSGLGTFGGWTQTTTFANGRTLVESNDIYGHATSKTDLGGHVWSYSYDVAGRLTQSGTGGLFTHFLYLNTGMLGSTVVGELNPQVNTSWSRTVATYSYDKLGQRLTEQTTEEYGYYTPGHYEYYGDPWDPYGYYYEYWVDESYYTSSQTIQNATVTYDALGRLKSFAEAGTGYSPAANIAYEYDANGNVRRTTATYRTLDQNGVASTYATTTDHWFRYDSMNRLVTDKGILRNGQIVRGETVYGSGTGQDILYNLAGERAAAIRTEYSPGYYDYEWGYYNPGYYYETRESYVYNSAGRLYEVQASTGGAAYEDYDYNTGLTTPPAVLPAAPVTGTVRSRFTYDLVGRQISQSDYEWNGTTVAYNRNATYNNKGQLTYDTAFTKKNDGYTYRSDTTYDYGYGSNYALGSTVSVYSRNYRNNNDANAPDTQTTNNYQWWDGAVQASITHKPNTAQSTTYTTSFYYNAAGQLNSVYVGDGRPRSVSFRLNADGQIIRRDESDNRYNQGDPHEVWYRFSGRQLGYVGNNSTSEVSAATSIAERQQTSPSSPGAFRNGATYGASYADFASSYDPINSYSQGSAGGSYTVRTGDTLGSIAQGLWGDASLWYKLAEANGLSGAAALTEGQTLVLPTGVVKSAHNASTLKPYSPGEAIGDVSPTTPQPQAAGKKNKCGVFGVILLAVIAVVVTVVTAGAALAAISPAVGGLASGISTILGTAVLGGTVVSGVGAGALIAAGAIGGVVGSIASQGVGVATGIQEKFSWKAVALAGIGGAVTAGIGPGGLFGEKGLFGALNASTAIQTGLRSAAGSAITQGIGVITGLQSKFDFVGVATAGIGAAVGSAVGTALGSEKGFLGIHAGAGTIGSVALTSTASALATAATRSAIEGSSFIDNFAASIPDIVTSILQTALVSAIDNPTEVYVETPEDRTYNESNEWILNLSEDQVAYWAGLGVTFTPTENGVLVNGTEGLRTEAEASAARARAGTPEPEERRIRSGLDTGGTILRDDDSYTWYGTQTPGWLTVDGKAVASNGTGIAITFNGSADSVSIMWVAQERSGRVTRFLTDGNQTFVFHGGSASFPSLGVTISQGVTFNPPPPIAPIQTAPPPTQVTQEQGPSLASQGFSLLLDVLPIVGTVKAGIQLVTGRDLITGERVNRWEQAAGLVVSFVPGGRALSRADDALRFGGRVLRSSDDLARAGARVDDVGELRRVGGPGGCFVAGTLVHTQDGLVPIEQIRIGTMVLSQSEHGGPLGMRRVNDVFVLEDKAIFEIAYTTAGGRTERQEATPNHPYWVRDLGWTAVEYLEVGQVLQLADGGEATVTEVRDTGVRGRVHNFEVDGYHTYYVGETGVWVHNNNCGAVTAGEGGRFGDLNARRVTGDNLTPHHMPQAAQNFTTRADGGALMMTAEEHALTRTFGARGRVTARTEAGDSFRSVLARDIRDVRSIVGSRYNGGIRDMIQYYKTNHPTLIARPPRR
jgi:YD repeat-containing protein